MANIGYIQVVRHCNHFCGFCSNPATPYEHDLESMKALVDDFVARDYFGIILTGGEPTLHSQLPQITEYARESGLHVRMITNGTRLADRGFAQQMASAGLQLAHVSIYSVRPEVEAKLRAKEGTLQLAFEALDACEEVGIDVNVNCVINKLNSDHLDENVRYLVSRHPQVRHFVWNNLDPSMGRAEVNQAQFTPRLSEFELSLQRALRFLTKTNRTFRVEKVPLCYMTSFAWASTETRKIIKGEERIVHFLDDKQTVRQVGWDHLYAEDCRHCSLRPICGGLFDRGGGYDPRELAPTFVPLDDIVRRVLSDGDDPSFKEQSLGAWQKEFAARENAKPEATIDSPDRTLLPVGQLTERSRRRFDSARRREKALADRVGVKQEK